MHILQTSFDLSAIVFAQVIQVALLRGDEEIALRAIAGGMPHHLFEGTEEGDGVHRHADVDGSGELRAHAAHALAGGPLTLTGFPLDDENVGAARFRQMIRNAGTYNTAANDDDVRRLQNTPPRND